MISVARRLVPLILGVVLSHSAAAKVSPPAIIWLGDLQHAEELVSAAIATTDAREMRSQSTGLARLLGRTSDDLGSVDSEGRFQCVLAAQALFNVTNDFALPPARALVALQRDAADFHSTMPKCETAIQRKAGRRTLPK